MFPSVTLFTDSQRYLFNCSENTQRVCSEHKVRLGKLQNVFFTRLNWQNVGGLPGLAMTLRDMGTPFLRLHGPENLASFDDALSAVLSKENVKLEISRELKGSPPMPTYCDENISVVSVELHNASSTNVEHSELVRDSSSSGESSADEDTVSKEPRDASRPKAKRIKRSSTPADVAMAFVCKLSDMPGKFNPSKAKELGLRPGPLYSKLVQGESVLTPEGKTIHPHEVLGAGRTGPTFVVLECPSAGFVESVVTHPLLQARAASQGPNPVLFVHIAPLEVLQDDRYCQWMKSFGEGTTTTHLLLHETLCPPEVTFRASVKLQCPLHLLCPDLYHLPYTAGSAPVTLQSSLKVQDLLPGLVTVGKPFLKYHFLPERKAGLDEMDVLKPLQQVLREQLSEIRSNPHLVSMLSGKSNEKLLTDTTVAEDGLPMQCPPVGVSNVTVTFLGTGSSLPSKYRNVSGILIRSPFNGSIVLDPGEGTLMQIYRCFGKGGGDEIIKQLKGVFVSHIHGDHHLGLISILLRHAELVEAGRDKLLTIGPGILGSWLRRYRKCQPVTFDFVNCSELTQLGSLACEAVKDRTGIGLSTVGVVHCRAAYGVTMQYPDGTRVVFSGDTRPCPGLIDAGQGTDLLLHEATFEDELMQDAIDRKHCTVSEALEVAEKMNAHFTLLTHFSQRYPKVSPALLNSECARAKTGIAFDCFSVSVTEVHRLPPLFTVLRDIFAIILDVEDISGISNSWFW